MLPDGAYPVYGANGVIGRYDKFNHIELIITYRGATCGSVNMSGPKSWITGNAMVVRPKHDSLKLRYLEYLFRGGLNVTKAITGAAQPQITRTNLAPMKISYPRSTEEQQRIIGILDKAFDAIATAKANAEKNLQNARALFDSHLESVFNERGEDWVERTLDEICIIGDGNHSSNYPRKDELVNVGIPFIRATNLVAGRISHTGMQFLSHEKHARLKKGHLKTGDILLTNRGEIGKTAIIDDRYDNANLNSQIAWLRCRDQVHNGFLFHALNSPDMQRLFDQSQNGAALQQFTIRQLRALRVPVPPKIKQQEIVSKLNVLNQETQRLESIYRQKLAALDALKKSLLHQAFAGEL
jgi:type I restriction enzyme S subunit